MTNASEFLNKERVVVSGPVHVSLTINDRLKAECSLSSRFLAGNAIEFLNEERERVVSGPVHFGLTFNDRLKAVRSLSSRFLATNASEFLNEERENCLRPSLHSRWPYFQRSKFPDPIGPSSPSTTFMTSDL